MDFKLGLMGGGNGTTNKNNGSDVSGGFNHNNSSSNRTSSSSEKSSSKCRPFSEVFSSPTSQEQHEQHNENNGSNKMARTSDSSLNNNNNNQFQQMMMHGRMRDSPTTTATTPRMQQVCSPTDSTAASEDVLVGNDGSSSDIHVLMPPPSFKQQQQQQQIQQQNLQQMYHQPQPYSKQLGMQLASMGGTLLGLHESAFGPRYPFTSIQWAELEHQALIFKYMMARAPLPPELIAPIRKSVAGAFHVGATSGVGGHHANHLDLEPGRCRRTDGKKWRCARLIVPDQKYCERHINRGKHKRKQQQANNVNGSTMHQPQQQQGNVVTTMVEPLKSTLGTSHHHHHQQHQIEQQQIVVHHQNHQQRAEQHDQRNFGVTQVQPNYMSAAPLSSKDRFLNTHVSKATFDLRPEQLLFSEVSGSTRAINQQQQQQQQQAILMNYGDPSRPSSNSTSLPYASYMRQGSPSVAEDAYNYYAVALTSSLQQEQPQNYINEDTKAALRPLFNEWPRSTIRDTSTVTSWSDSEDNTHTDTDTKHTGKFFQKMLSRNTSLSMSGSGNIPLASDDNSSPTKNSPNMMVKLSMGSGCSTTSRDVEQATVTTTTTTMTNDDDSSESNTDHASNKLLRGGSSDLGWFSAAKVSLGGPLAEAFNASEVKPTTEIPTRLPSSSSLVLAQNFQNSSSSSSVKVKFENL